MKKSNVVFLLAISFCNSKCFSAPQHEQSKVELQKLQTAKSKTASALLSILTKDSTRDTAELMARLGYIDPARRLLSTLPSGSLKSVLTSNITVYATRKALSDGRLNVAEREIRSLKADKFEIPFLWLTVSRKYSERKQFGEAKRTAFYALKIVRERKLSFGWQEIAVHLCEIGDQEAARRVFAIATKELIGPELGWGLSPYDTVIETAARCGFDDIAFKTKVKIGNGAVIIWALQNRDDVARRFIERQIQVITEANKAHLAINPDNPYGPPESELKDVYYQALVQGQRNRGDIPSATKTIQEIDAWVDTDPSRRDWFSKRMAGLSFYESTGQWVLADKSILVLDAYLKNRKIFVPPPELNFPASPDSEVDALKIAKLSGLRVIFHPEKYDIEQRQLAFKRVKPRLLEFALSGPNQKLRAYIALARAQRSLGSSQWRNNLRVAQKTMLATKPSKDKLFGLALIGRVWGEAGEKEQVRLVGKQMSDSWQQGQETSKAKPGEKLAIVNLHNLLLFGGCFEEVSQQIFTKQASVDYFWLDTVRALAAHLKAAPPAKLLALPIEQRRQALTTWAISLTPEEPSDFNYKDLNPVHEEIF